MSKTTEMTQVDSTQEQVEQSDGGVSFFHYDFIDAVALVLFLVAMGFVVRALWPHKF